TNIGVYTATDGGSEGEQWHVLGEGLPNVPVMQLKISPTRKLIAATYGRGVWKLDLSSLADLAITKSDSPDPVVTGSNITYTITVRNSGPTDASTVTVTDNLPSTTTFVACSVSGGVGGTCGGSSNNRTITFTSIPANTAATITLTALANCSV